MTYGYLRYEGLVFRITSPSFSHYQDTSYLQQLNLKAIVFRRLRNHVSRQAQAAASKETANTQPSSDDEQPEPTLVCSPGSSPTAVEVRVTVVTNKGNKRKKQVSESEEDEVPANAATDKSCKRKKQNPKIQENPDPFKLMMNYFDKRFDRIVKKSQQPSNKNAKMEDIFKFKHKGNRVQFEFNNQILQIVQNLSSALNNDDPSEANDLSEGLTAKLKHVETN